MYQTMNTSVLRAVANLLLALADTQEGAPGMSDYVAGADAFANGHARPMPGMPPFLAEMLRQAGVPLPTGPGFGQAEDDGAGLYGDEDNPSVGGTYEATPEGGNEFDENAIKPVAFDPYDLPLWKYENCSEKTRQEEKPERRDALRDDPMKWMDQAIYYAHQMVDEACDAEEAARCFLCLPGGPALRRRKVKGDATKPYDEAWAQVNNLIQTAYDSDRLDAPDFQACMILLGAPFNAILEHEGVE